jgi:hypothetical protein
VSGYAREAGTYDTARDDRLCLADVSSGSAPDAQPLGDEATCAGRKVLVRDWLIEHSGAVEALTQDHREMVLGRIIDNPIDPDRTWWPSVPYLTYQVQRQGRPCDHLFADSGGLETASMAGFAGAMAERLVPAELARASS